MDIPYKFKTNNGKEVEFVHLYAPNGNDKMITCMSDFKYLPNTNIEGINSIPDNDINSPKRRKRYANDIEVFNQSATEESQKLMKKDGFDDFQNRTFYINCTVEEVSCRKVKCFIDSIKTGDLITIHLQMVFNISAIKGTISKLTNCIQ